MKLLVTGGSGFIGSNFIIRQINEHGNSVLNYDALTYAGNLANLISVKDNPLYLFIKGNICDKTLLSSTVNEYKPDAIINFAAETHVDRSIDDPINFIRTNVAGTANIVDVLKDYHKKSSNFKFLHISTDEVFGSLGKKGLFNENSPYAPRSPYAASKAASDHIVQSWAKTFQLPFIISNCSNNYGPFQFPEKLIPLMIANAIDEKPLPIYGSGSNIRDWLHVNDHCNALNLIINKGRVHETYCIGGNNEHANIDIVNLICSKLDRLKARPNKLSYKDLITFVTDRPGHDFRYAIDSTKIQNELGWKPIESMENGINNTIKWYLNNEGWWRKIQKNSYSQERLGLESLNDNINI